MTSFALVDQLRQLPPGAATELLESLTARETCAIEWEWEAFWARVDQLPPPGGWTFWFLCGGRGGGKTFSAAHWVVQRAWEGKGPIRLIAGTDDDVRSTMVEDESGILACSPPWFMPRWDPSVGNAGQLTWPNGVKGRGYSAEAPSRLRGKQAQTDWYDDLTNWGNKAQKTLDQAAWGLRKGDARCVITASPEDVEHIVELIENPMKGLVRTGSGPDANIANLAQNFFNNVMAKYIGTEQEQAERYGVLVKKSKKSPFWGIDFAVAPIRVACPAREDLVEVVVVIDPTETANDSSDECGLVVMGRDHKGHVYVLEDLTDCVEPEVWGARAIDAAARWKASVFVAENNRGEATVRNVLNAAYLRRRLSLGQQGAGVLLPIIGVTAIVGKQLRAGPVRQLYVAGLLHHVPGLGKLEAQERGWDPAAPKKPKQDDHIDAVVHGAIHLARLDEEQKRPAPRGSFRIPGMM